MLAAPDIRWGGWGCRERMADSRDRRRRRRHRLARAHLDRRRHGRNLLPGLWIMFASATATTSATSGFAGPLACRRPHLPARRRHLWKPPSPTELGRGGPPRSDRRDPHLPQLFSRTRPDRGPATAEGAAPRRAGGSTELKGRRRRTRTRGSSGQPRTSSPAVGAKVRTTFQPRNPWFQRLDGAISSRPRAPRVASRPSGPHPARRAKVGRFTIWFQSSGPRLASCEKISFRSAV